MNSKIKKVYFSNVILFSWFFLDMTGFELNNSVLVSQSWEDDGIFFIIYLTSLLLFIFKEKLGKFILCGWLFTWLITQFYFHWWYTICGPSEGKIKYFSNTIKLIDSSTIYIPDLYHITLHIFILVSLIYILIYIKKNKNA